MKASIIAVVNPEPHSGKTTVVEVLARDLAEAGHKVLAIDADPKATLTEKLERLIIEGSLADVLGSTIPITEVIHATLYPFELVPSFSDLGDWVDDISINQFKRALAPALDRYDYILIDAPSAINALALSIINCADALLAPVHHRIRRPTPIDRHHVAFIPKKMNKRLNDLYDFVSDDLFFLPSSLLW
jgi:chromosome partitioning protein